MTLVAALLLAGVPPARAAAATAITVDGGQGGRTFDGIGAISGGGGNSRLLRDYPAAQQSQILDYLFKPGYGANLQLLKLEIGGDANSTDGSEPSTEHTRGQINCDAGYEFWLAEQAKARYPDIKFYGLAWAAPGWINGGFWSTDTINYLISWLGCARQHGLTVSYLGGWNEKGHNVDWYIQLRSALDDAGYDGVQIVGDDSGWSVDVPGFSQANGAKPALWSCNGGTNQTWTSSTTNQLTVYDSKCLEVTGGATADGSPVEIWDCNGGTHQQWRVRSDGSVVNVGSGKCLDAVGHGTANGTALEIWTCTGGANQIWRLT
ncbi:MULTISPECIES: ricin-type beta-trefoil lectin domain protein [Streptomyces]|uniref:ricin-type beta-trefoil lectin domain protein n=1 Tax=Streptomyces TaxID=1883 RepID=UPI0021F8E3B9|nr:MULTISPECIES: ricin-type beta-trefoil lectin domain protein [Streptomyces]